MGQVIVFSGGVRRLDISSYGRVEEMGGKKMGRMVSEGKKCTTRRKKY